MQTPYKYDYLIFIGRFQSYHSGHHHIATEALKLAERLIFVLGSHDRPRDIRNPFTTDERISIIKNALEPSQGRLVNTRLLFAPQVDYTYNDEKWIAAVQSGVQSLITHTYRGAWQSGHVPRVGLVGFDKDRSSYYLKKFPQWKVEPITPKNSYSATELREGLFSQNLDSLDDYFINASHAKQVLEYLDAQPILKKEYQHVIDYRKGFEVLPYEPVFSTVDGVVTQSGHILLVQRKAMPGEGLWALPGGFLKAKEKMTLLDSVIDELREETKLKVPTPVLVGSIAKVKTYDDPYRSVRGRTITTAYHFRLNDDYELPKVKGGDDAAKAKWFTLNDFMNMRSVMFEDHFCIATDMLGI